VIEFLEALIQSILTDLYQYSDDRISEIAGIYKERMDNEALTKFRDALR